MSIEATRWAWAQAVELPSIKLVLLALADHANKEGECWPGITRISTMTGLSQPTIWRAMAQLTAMGMVQQIPKGRSYRYALNLTDTIQHECNPSVDTIHGDSDTIHGDSDSIHGELNTIHGECLTVKNHKEPPKEPKRLLSPDWKPDDKLMLWAQERAPHVDTAEQTERFIDHFCYIKTDRRTDRGWDASWRGWILRSRRDYQRAPIPFPTRSQRTSQRNAAIVGDALAGRTQADAGATDCRDLPFRLIEGGKAGAD
jgi:hypothetical protein